jgi:hypothetical protein
MQIVIDKSTWGPGPWQDEPDRVEWRHAGFPCLAVRNTHFGTWCGYAGLPPGHPLYGHHDEGLDIEVHGGLTYSGACHMHICHVPEPGEPEHVWWLGFDCGHYLDYAPGAEARFPTSNPDDIYRTLAYVQAETNRLAEQLTEAAHD